jgi:hypothetical protein
MEKIREGEGKIFRNEGRKEGGRKKEKGTGTGRMKEKNILSGSTGSAPSFSTTLHE